MGLIKEKILSNGIPVTYHRIVRIDNIINNKTIIEVASYINKEKRQEEIEALENSASMDVFINASFYEKEYEEETSIKLCYEYLKTLEDFIDAEDDEEENIETEVSEETTESSEEKEESGGEIDG